MAPFGIVSGHEAPVLIAVFSESRACLLYTFDAADDLTRVDRVGYILITAITYTLQSIVTFPLANLLAHRVTFKPI